MNEGFPPDGDQLELRLPGILRMSEMPWGGQSPRVLTSAYARFTLKAQAAKSVSDSADSEQYDLFTKAAHRYSGAPLLISLRRRS